MYQFNPFAIPPLIASIYTLSLGLFIFAMRRKVWTNFVCSLTYYCVFIWLFGYSMLYLTKEPATLLWPKFVYAGVVFIGTTIYHFSVVLLDLKNQRRFVFLAYLISLLFFCIVGFTNYLIIDVKRHFWGYHTLVNPFMHSIFLIFFGITYVAALWNMYKEYRRKKLKQEQPVELNRIKYFLMQYSIGMLGSIDYLADWGFGFYPCGGYIVIIGISFVAYAIVRHRLLDIRVAITRTGIFIGVYAIVLGLPFAIAGWFKTWLIATMGASWWFVPLGLMACSATFGPFIYIYIERKVERRLLQEYHRYQDVLRQAAREMARIHNPKRLLNFIVHVVTKTVRITHSAIYLLDAKTNQFILGASRNLAQGQISLINRDNPLIAWFEDQGESVVYEEVQRRAQEGHASIFKELEEQIRLLNATVIVPSFLENRLSAILILGDKLSRRIYTSEDLNIFSLLANQAGLAIENAQLYENIEEKVRQRTKELVEVQKQLIHAEKLATVGTLAGGVAHEINNPLTAILTNVQMLLASDTIDNKLDRESLELIEEATKRCRTIVQKLMTYARKPLETSGITKLNLIDILNSVISFLGYQLEQDNIRLVTDAKEEKYSVMGNRNELEQVLTNLILNAKDAIKQIKKGGNIYITFSETGNGVKVEVKDEGDGISKEIEPKIFDPFFTTKDVGKGVGLGLSICQAIVEKHNGTLTFKSEAGKGTTFTIQLPKAGKETGVQGLAGGSRG